MDFERCGKNIIRNRDWLFSLSPVMLGKIWAAGAAACDMHASSLIIIPCVTS